jgi:predicted 3-demethylubiquinone-9 3-methyltransferase (glyoxalase superfamily)
MFTGNAEEAMRHYEKALPALVIEEITRHADGDMAGKILTATARLGAHELMFHDSPPVHAFSFTPSISLFVDLTGAQDFDEAVRILADGGQFLMPPDNYGFSRRFAWVQDKFGVSWQINLP